MQPRSGARPETPKALWGESDAAGSSSAAQQQHKMIWDRKGKRTFCPKGGWRMQCIAMDSCMTTLIINSALPPKNGALAALWPLLPCRALSR